MLFKTEILQGFSRKGTCMTYKHNTNVKFSRWNLIHLLLLLGAGLLLFYRILPEGSLFGSQTDWFSQHLTIADYMRTHFYATGEFFPDFSGLGGGSNFFTLSYYGFLRPDIMLSYFLPDVSMKLIIQGYAVFEVLAGALLLYYWLFRKEIGNLACFVSGFFYLTANCMFQAHRQIMFVNYLPFLILALLSIDNCLASFWESRREWFRPHPGLVLSLLMILLHSFYFFPSCFAVCTIYLWFQSRPLREVYGTQIWKSQRNRLWKKYILSVTVSVCMAMVLLFPTAFAILENKKDVKATSISSILAVNPSLDSLLYSAYGCGLTVFCLYALFLSIRRKDTRKLAAAVFCLLFFDIFYWILNGTLYVRPKSLIPFVPIILYLTALTIDGLQKNEIHHSLPLALLSVIPVLVQIVYLSPKKELEFLMKADAAVLVFCVLLGLLRKKTRLNTSGFLYQLAACMLLCAVPAQLYLEKAKTEHFTAETENSRETFSNSDIAAFASDSLSRMDDLERSLNNSNYAYFGEQNKSTMYSSVSNSNYNHLYYDILRMPISIRNRVAICADANPFQEYLMGVRYIQTTDKKVPSGYEIKKEKNGHVLAENASVLPVAYGSTALIHEEDFDAIPYPQNLDTLANRTVVPAQKDDLLQPKDGAYDPQFLPYRSKMQAYELPEEFFSRETIKESCTLTKPLPKTVESGQILLLSFDISYKGKKDISVTINGIKNCLSGSNAPYPNRNTTFTYMLSGDTPVESLEITFSKGNYDISNVSAYTIPVSALDHPGISAFHPGKTSGRQLLNGEITMEEDGYFVTSFAFSHGYTATVDGKKVTPVEVNKAFAGFPLTKGTHEIQLEFHAPGKTAGLFISALAACYFIFDSLLYSLWMARHKNRILHRVRVVSFTDSVPDKAHSLIKSDSRIIASADLQMDRGHAPLSRKAHKALH